MIALETLNERITANMELVGEIEITNEFLAHRMKQMSKLKQGKRTVRQFAMHCDCQIVEYEFLKLGLVNAPTKITHDFRIEDAIIDAKMIAKNWFNVPAGKDIYYLKNIANGELTHFAFFQYESAPDRPFEVGDKVRVKFLGIQPARRVLERVQRSKFKDEFGNYGYCYAV